MDEDNNIKFYRYVAIEYASTDYDGEYVQSSIPNPKLELHIFNLYKETPKGYWIGYGKPNNLHDKGKWVSKTSRKRYAYPTKEEALNNYIKRTERRIRILSWQLKVSKISVSLAKDLVL
jgi:hypothetical protein